MNENFVINHRTAFFRDLLHEFKYERFKAKMCIKMICTFSSKKQLFCNTSAGSTPLSYNSRERPLPPSAYLLKEFPIFSKIYYEILATAKLITFITLF